MSWIRGRSTFLVALSSALLAAGALGFSIFVWFDQQSAQAYQSSLAQAAEVYFAGNVQYSSSGTPDIEMAIENYGPLPIPFVEIKWSNGTLDRYPAIPPCEEITFSFGLRPNDSNPFAFMYGSTLEYRMPDGSQWARIPDNPPRKIDSIYVLDTATQIPLTQIQSCSVS